MDIRESREFLEAANKLVKRNDWTIDDVGLIINYMDKIMRKMTTGSCGVEAHIIKDDLCKCDREETTGCTEGKGPMLCNCCGKLCQCCEQVKS